MKKRPILFVLIPLCLLILIWESFLPLVFVRNHYSKHYVKGSAYQILIKSDGELRNKTIKYRGEVIRCVDGNLQHITEGDVLVYFPKSDSVFNIKFGDIILTNSSLRPIENFIDSSSFDYKRMMKRKKIYDNVFLSNADWKRVAENQGNLLITKARKVNRYFQNKLLNSKLPKQEAALAIGMLLGEKEYIDEDTQENFREAGLTHILVVSGMNIAIILIVLESFLKFFFFGRERLILVRKIILVLMAFALCFVVSLTPSALRVAIMMLAFLFSKQSNRGYDSLNVFFVTVFIFLIFDPMILFDWSFQFSFLAVFGIILFASWKHRLFPKFKFNYFLRQGVSAAGMTLSAQTFLFPLLLWRFRVIYPYMLLFNIIIVPFMSIVLITIILFLLLSDIVFVGTVVETLMHWELYLLMKLVGLTEALPYSSINI